MVTQVDEPDDLAELGRRPRQEEAAPEEVAGALNPFPGTVVPLVALRRGDDRADEERTIDTPPGEAEGISHVPPAMHPQIADRAKPPGQRAAPQPEDRVPLAVGEGGKRSDVLAREVVFE